MTTLAAVAPEARWFIVLSLFALALLVGTR